MESMSLSRTRSTESYQMTRIVLGRLFMLCIRDKIDVVTGHFGGSSTELRPVLDDFVQRMPGFPKTYLVRNEPWSSEICTIVFVHQYSIEEREPIQAACNEEMWYSLVLLVKTDFRINARNLGRIRYIHETTIFLMAH